MSEFGNGRSESPISSAQPQVEAHTQWQTLTWQGVESVAKPLLHELEDNSGTVTREKLAQAVRDPSITGEQAQVLAGLYGEFAQITRLPGGDGSTISDQSLTALQQKLYDSEKRAYDLIGLDHWTKSHFAQLDKDYGSKGYLTRSDVTAAAARASGPDSEMLQQLGNEFSHIAGGSADHMTPENVRQYLGRYIAKDFKFTTTFEKMMDRAGQAERFSPDLFSDSGNPTRSINAKGVNQGPMMRDCNFNAPLSSLAQLRPGDVTSVISKDDDGSYTVRFPGADHAVRVPAPTYAEQGIYDGASPMGIWSAVLEEAYGQLKLDSDPAMRMKNLLPQEAIDQPAPLVDAIKTLTGHDAEEKVLMYMNKKEVTDILQQSLNGSPPKIVTLGSGSPLKEGTTKDGFPLNHGFSVLSFKPDGGSDGQVVIRDTWGAGGKNDDGIYTISVQQLQANFYDIAYEK